jgi:hypothetical protein
MLSPFRLALCLILFCTTTFAASVGRIITYKGIYTGSQCSLPNNTATDFTPTDQKVHVYVEIDGLKTTDSMGLMFIFGGQQIATPFTPVPTDNNYCWSDVWLDISQFTSSSAGSWTVQVYVNGQSLLPVGVFTLTVAGGGTTNASPHIDGVNPKSVSVGVESLFALTGTGFQQGFAAKLWVNGSSYPVDATKVAWTDSQHVQLNVRVGAVGDRTTSFGLQVTNPGGQPSNIYDGLTAVQGGVGGGGTPTVSWVAAPPSAIQSNNQTFPVTWSLSNAAGMAYSHVHVSADANGVLHSPQATTNTQTVEGASGNYSEQISPSSLLSTSFAPGTVVYYAVHLASDTSGNSAEPNYYSQVVQSAVGTSTPPASITASWISGSPPAYIISGQAFSLSWQVSGASQIQSRACYGTTSDPNGLCQQQSTPWQNSGTASLTASLTAPVVTGAAPQTYYFVIQAQGGGQTAYSTVGSSLDTGTTIGPSNVQTWIYDSSSYSQLNGFSIRLDKEHLSDGKYQYRISVTPDYNSSHSLDSAQLILLRPNAVTFDRQNTQILINHDSPQQILSSPAFDWQNPPSPYGGPPHFVQVVLDIVGLLNPEVGTIQGLAELANDLSSADPTVGPSSWFEGMMNDDNNYHVNRFFIGQQVHLFGSNPTHGIRFTVTEVNESSGQAPQFLVIAKDSFGAIVGAEIGLDRKILATRAQGKAALQYILVF